MSVLPASARGWGQVGRPGSKQGQAYRVANVVKVTAGGITVWVHKAIAPLVKFGIEECTRRGYRFDGVVDDWGWAHRYIRGSTTTLSNHSWALALDFNATKNPMTGDGIVHTDMPAWVVAVWTRLGFSWGGNYSGKRKDPMHMEWLGTPATAAAMVRDLTAAPLPSSPEDTATAVAQRHLWSLPDGAIVQPRAKLPAVRLPTPETVTALQTSGWVVRQHAQVQWVNA